MINKNKKNIKISILGLGYVGSELLKSLSTHFHVNGFDTNRKKIFELKKKVFNKKNKKDHIEISDSDKILKNSNIFIITVPTPIKINTLPDLRPLEKATSTICKYIMKNSIVILESTVYPGITRNVCGAMISKKTKLKLNTDFFLGYSPERIDPGNKKLNIQNINKLISSSNKYALDLMNYIYSKIVKVKVIKVDQIEIAEAAKVLENIQRDVNIALLNEVTQICDIFNLNITAVLKAAKTKWNFLDFNPGLVGGHCIGVDPYYLIHGSIKKGYNPKLISTSRSINKNFLKYIFKKINILIRKKNLSIKKLNVLILGIAFKKNIDDIRNSQSLKIYNYFKIRSLKTDLCDPVVEKNQLVRSSNFKFIKFRSIYRSNYDIIILMNGHDVFKKINIKKLRDKTKLIIDLDQFFPIKYVDFNI